jgi:hypothetical protein
MIKISTAGDILASLLTGDSFCMVFLHNTRDEDTANKIIKEGYRFEEQLSYSCDRVNPDDTVEINYFLVERKEYGKFTIIIEIDKHLFRKYSSLADHSDIHFEDIISIALPVLGDNDEYIYTLAPQYIKGYLDIVSGKFRKNRIFNPAYEPALYMDNHRRLTSGEQDAGSTEQQ